MNKNNNCAFDERPVGIFDSGLGGLTAVRALELLLPHENIVYFGDTARLPYGTRSPKTIKKYALSDLTFLKTHNIKAALAACGTVSTAAREVLTDENFPIFDVAAPAVTAAASATKNGKVALIATQASVSSGVYGKLLHAFNPKLQLFSQSCPLLVPLVESGHTSGQVVNLVLQEYLAPLKQSGADVLILGCTHYPLLSDAIYKILPITQINPSQSAAELLSASITKSARTERGETKIYVSDDMQGFSALASMLLGRACSANLVTI